MQMHTKNIHPVVWWLTLWIALLVHLNHTYTEVMIAQMCLQRTWLKLQMTSEIKWRQRMNTSRWKKQIRKTSTLPLTVSFVGVSWNQRIRNFATVVILQVSVEVVLTMIVIYSFQWGFVKYQCFFITVKTRMHTQYRQGT